jgi:restriction system protein
MSLDVHFRDHRIYMVHLLRVLHGSGPVSPGSIYDQVADRAGVSAEQRVVGSDWKGNPVYRNRIQFARQGLIDAGLLIGSSDPQWQRGIWELNPEGNAIAGSDLTDDALDNKLRALSAQGVRERARDLKASRALAGLDSSANGGTEESTEEALNNADETPTIADLVDEANEVAMRTMLEHVRGLDDRVFEYLVGSVLKAALRAESVRVTQKSKDGGIDGVLNFDGLGMRTAVFEAKRYAEGNVVSRPQIDAFATAARRQRAAHSLFVTSGRFSSDSVAAGLAEGIRLIDGSAFVELMARHGIGLREREAYIVYEVDPAWSVSTDDDVTPS